MGEYSNDVFFSPEERQGILDRVLSVLQNDARIAGVLIVGSGAVGFDDEYSDIDLSVVVAEEDDVTLVFREWRGQIESLLSVIQCFESYYGPNNYLYGFLLSNFLELDIGFLCLANLIAKKPRWEIAPTESSSVR